MSDDDDHRLTLPPFSKPVFIGAILFNLIVFTGLSRAGIFVALMLVFNIAICAVIYFAILGHFNKRMY